MFFRSEPVNADDLSTLIGDIYECALDPARWDDTLTRFVSLFSPPGWEVAALMWEGMNRPGVRWVGTTSLIPQAIQAYELVFAGRNVWSSQATGLPLGQVVDTDNLVTRVEFLKSDLYQKFLKTWGMEQALFVIFERTDDEQLALALPGPPDCDLVGLKRGLRLIGPHVQRTMRISHGLAEARLRASGAEAALNMGHIAVLALTEDLIVVSQNAKAQALAAFGLFSANNRRIIFADADAQNRILQLARHDGPASDAFRIEDAHGASYAVLGLTIRPQREAVLGGMVEGARILVSISSPHPTPLIEVNRLCAWFDFTPSEAKLAAALVDGESLSSYASMRGVSVEAARFLLKGAFRKTGATSQAQLVTLIKQVPQG